MIYKVFTQNHFSASILAGMLMSLAIVSSPQQAQASQPLLDGLGGTSGFGENFLDRNDDGSTGRFDLPFAINLYGSTYSTAFLNNNGNITFESALSAFTPSFFPGAPQPIIAPYWADVDTRNPGSGLVYYAAPNPDTIVFTWDRVGYYFENADLLNSFQAILRNRADTGVGNFDIEYRYNQLEWTTGDASGGSGGFGGTPAVAGFDSGNGVDFFNLPGSATENILNILNTSNVSPSTPGLWSIAVRNGETPGGTPDNPLLPVVVDGTFTFDFNVQANIPVFIDPVVAIGYDYTVTGGPLFSSVQFPVLGVGDNIYNLFADTSGGACSSFGDTGITVMGGTFFNFTNPTNCFGVRGIEEEAALDPTDVTAFVTGLTFDSNGQVFVTQTPVVPEPLTILGAGTAVGFMARFKKHMKRQAKQK
ncbi:MAG: hypothetical protein RLZZ490_1581 [Cyanobacteriota bacterium]